MIQRNNIIIVLCFSMISHEAVCSGLRLAMQLQEQEEMAARQRVNPLAPSSARHIERSPVLPSLVLVDAIEVVSIDGESEHGSSQTSESAKSSLFRGNGSRDELVLQSVNEDDIQLGVLSVLPDQSHQEEAPVQAPAVEPEPQKGCCACLVALLARCGC